MLLTMPMDGSSALFLLIAVQFFEASATSKAIIAAGPFVGLLLAPLALQAVSKLQIPVSRAITYIYIVSGLCCFIAAASPAYIGFLIGVIGFSIFVCVTPPLSLAMWRQNSPDQSRGGVYSRLMKWGIVSKIAIGFLLSLWLGDDITRFWLVPVLFGCFLFLAAYCVYQIPSDPPEKNGRLSVPQQFSLIWQNKTFGILLGIWMLFGFASLMTLPLRTEYIASGAEFIAYSPMYVVLLIDVIPSTCRLLAIPIWGKLFDKINFLFIRIAINFLFGLSIFLFFTPVFALQIASAILFGLAQGGGSLAWNLWVTKYAPPERTADYMAVHTSLTGVRGIFAPLVAYALIGAYTFSELALIASGLIALSILLILPLIAKEYLRARPITASSLSETNARCRS